jgi:hypothetical protein
MILSTGRAQCARTPDPCNKAASYPVKTSEIRISLSLVPLILNIPRDEYAICINMSAADFGHLDGPVRTF